MLFQSIDYLLFVAVIFAAYWALPHRAQNVLLVAGGAVFYGWVHPWFLGLIAVSIITDFFAARAIEDHPRHRRSAVWISVAVNLSMLGVFKYYGFFVDNLNVALRQLGLTSLDRSTSWILPVGISFYTFQTMSYTIDVYRGRIKACRDPIDFSLYVSFFPQLVAGPIERATRLLPQIQSQRGLHAVALREGLLLMVWGFFKKLVIADNVAVTANKIFAVEDPNFWLLWSGVFAFCIQIYADFSAYTDIARGTARLLGFELVDNFDHPYVSQTPDEFWRRWHMSLSYWLRDYVYIPLGGSRAGVTRWAINILIVFGLSGLWHGASWNFVLWGLYWAALVIAYRAVAAISPSQLFSSRALAPVRILVMFALTNVGWMLFRETDFDYILRYLMLDPFAGDRFVVRAAAYLALNTALYATPLYIHTVYDFFLRPKFGDRVGLRIVAAAAMVIAILALRSPVDVDFIYFQF